jgi:hypothetical protein
MNELKFLKKMQFEAYTDAHFDALLQIVDGLHDAAAARQLDSVTSLSPMEVVGWLDDIIFTAEETIREIQKSMATPELAQPKGWYEN